MRHAKPAALGGRSLKGPSPNGPTHTENLSSLGDPQKRGLTTVAPFTITGEIGAIYSIETIGSIVKINERRKSAGQPKTGWAEGSAASTRSATDSPVSPASARSSAGLP